MTDQISMVTMIYNDLMFCHIKHMSSYTLENCTHTTKYLIYRSSSPRQWSTCSRAAHSQSLLPRPRIFLYIVFIHFAKLYDRFEIYQIWPPTVVAHGSCRGLRRLHVQPPWPTFDHFNLVFKAHATWRMAFCRTLSLWAHWPAIRRPKPSSRKSRHFSRKKEGRDQRVSAWLHHQSSLDRKLNWIPWALSLLVISEKFG
jgi:hypothetical protein